MANVTQFKKAIYTARVHATGGRDGGRAHSDDGRLDIKLSLPGGPGAGTNPEQLLAAGWASCFTSAIKSLAAKKKVRLPSDMSIDAEVDLCQGDDGYSIQARLNVSLPGLDHEVAQELADDAEQICPYSKATRGNIGVSVNVVSS